MGVGIQSDSVGAQLGHLCQRAIKRLGGLARQPVNQIHIDRLKAQRTRRFHQRKHLLCGLNAVHRLLNLGIKILHTEAQSIEAQFRQHRQPIRSDRARIHLDGILTTRRKGETAPQRCHELAQSVIRKEGRRAAPEVQLADHLSGAAVGRVQINLAAEVAQIHVGTVMVLGDDLVAGTVVAQRFAKRNVDIQRQRQCHGRSAKPAL